jgi:hypothetical protein
MSVWRRHAEDMLCAGLEGLFEIFVLPLQHCIFLGAFFTINDSGGTSIVVFATFGDDLESYGSNN